MGNANVRLTSATMVASSLIELFSKVNLEIQILIVVYGDKNSDRLYPNTLNRKPILTITPVPSGYISCLLNAESQVRRSWLSTRRRKREIALQIISYQSNQNSA
jgi:hypothetical protein